MITHRVDIQTLPINSSQIRNERLESCLRTEGWKNSREVTLDLVIVDHLLKAYPLLNLVTISSYLTE